MFKRKTTVSDPIPFDAVIILSPDKLPPRYTGFRIAAIRHAASEYRVARLALAVAPDQVGYEGGYAPQLRPRRPRPRRRRRLVRSVFGVGFRPSCNSKIEPFSFNLGLVVSRNLCIFTPDVEHTASEGRLQTRSTIAVER